MLSILIKTIFFFSLSSFLFFAEAKNIGSETGLNIPRFVSLKSDEVNLRVGSSLNYPKILTYTTKNFPVKIMEEYNTWRKIEDFKGNKGWIHKALLKGDRFAIINQPYENNLKILNKPKGKIIGEIGKNNIVKINKCIEDWCSINFNNYKGWIKKNNLWGVSSNEKINVPIYQPIINFIWKFDF
tara:strand:+ start:715 stop:1266 length:552 start_codon:yes stop_codon:yes gene_type:complete